MDIEQLLLEKKKKLEELKKQRQEKQDNLISHFSSPSNTDTTQDNKEPTPIINSTTTTREKDLLVTTKIIEPIIPKKTVLYSKTTTTEDIDYQHHVPDEKELATKIHRNLEKQIRKELEEKYKTLYAKAVKEYTDLNKPDAIHVDEPASDSNITSSLDYPTTKIKHISISDSDNNKILTLHDDCICIWKRVGLSLALLHNISLYTTINIALFDSQDPTKIITGSESGFVYIFNLTDNSQLRSTIQLKSIVSIYRSSRSLMLVTSDGSYTIIAMNLVDIISPTTNFLTSPEFKFTNDTTLTEEEFNITECCFINVNNIVVALLSSKVISVDFGQQMLHTLYDNPNDLPIMSLSYNQGRVMILGLDHSVRIIGVTTGLNIADPVDLPRLSFSAEWLTPSTFVSYSINNESTIWKIQNDKIVKLKTSTDDTSASAISAVEVIDPLTLVTGDLKGGVQIVNVN